MGRPKKLEKTYLLNDKDIRFEFLKRNKDFFRKNYFANEFGINSTNVVDFASFDFNNKLFYGFEIKSARDNLLRLYKQLTSYTTFFNIVYVISHEKHIEGVLEIINNYRHLQRVGVIKVSNSLEFEEIKQASLYKPFFDLFIRNLDLEDLRMICENKGLNVDGSKKQLVSAMKLRVSLDEVYKGIYNKVLKYHAKKCSHCGSNLYYNTRKNGEPTICHCVECGHEIMLGSFY